MTPPAIDTTGLFLNKFIDNDGMFISFLHSGRTNAPVAQWIEQWPPEPCAYVRFVPGVMKKAKMTISAFSVYRSFFSSSTV